MKRETFLAFSVATQVEGLKVFDFSLLMEDSSLLELKVVETENVLNGLIRAL